MVRRLLRLVRPYWRRLGLASVCLLISNAATLVVPSMLRLLTDNVFVHHTPGGLDQVAVLLLAIIVVSAIFSYARGYLIAYATKSVAVDLRIAMYHHLQRLALSFYDGHRTGDIMARLTTDTALVQSMVTDNLLLFVQHVVLLSAVGVIVIVTDWRLALVTLSVAPLLVIGGRVVGRRVRQLSERAQQRLGEASTVLEETLSAVRVVRSFGHEDYETERYAEAVNGAFVATLTTARLRALFDAGVATASLCAVALVLWAGGHEVLAGHLSPGGMISFLFYLMILAGPLQGLASLYTAFEQALGGADRIFALLDAAPDTGDAPTAYALPPLRGRLTVDDVWFSYTADGPPVLRGVSLEVEPGQSVAIVGPSALARQLWPRCCRASTVLRRGVSCSTATISPA